MRDAKGLQCRQSPVSVAQQTKGLIIHGTLASLLGWPPLDLHADSSNPLSNGEMWCACTLSDSAITPTLAMGPQPTARAGSPAARRARHSSLPHMLAKP